MGIAQAGAIVCVLGLAFAISARVTLGRSWGMPTALHDDPELVTSGPYRFVRHSIYTGMGAMLIGTSLVFPVAGVPCAITIVYTVFAARARSATWSSASQAPISITRDGRSSSFHSCTD